MRQMSEQTGRNVIAYYSGWLQKPKPAVCLISDLDKNGLMSAVHGLDRSKGKLPKKQSKLVEAWCLLHINELRAAWKAWNESGVIIKIEGLR